MAMGSLAEVETQIEIARRLGYMTATDANPLLQQASIVGEQLYALRDALNRKP